MDWLTQGEPFSHSQSIDALIDQLGQLTVSLAFVNEQMVITKKVWNKKKVKAYLSLMMSSVAQEQYFAPSLAKDYINAKCNEEELNYDLCERTSRTITHFIDSIRTAISALKMEAQYVQG